MVFSVSIFFCSCPSVVFIKSLGERINSSRKGFKKASGRAGNARAKPSLRNEDEKTKRAASETPGKGRGRELVVEFS